MSLLLRQLPNELSAIAKAQGWGDDVIGLHLLALVQVYVEPSDAIEHFQIAANEENSDDQVRVSAGLRGVP